MLLAYLFFDKNMKIVPRVMLVLSFAVIFLVPCLILFGIYKTINYFCDRSVGWIEAILFLVGYIIFVEVWANLRPWLKLNSLRKELKNKRKENLLEEKSEG